LCTVRFSARMLARARAAAEAEGMGLGAWVRRLVSFELIRLSRERPSGPVTGVRLGEPKALRSSLALSQPTSNGHGLTFRCPHLSVGNVTAAECRICGPLEAVA
jgi:hypothetical protein